MTNNTGDRRVSVSSAAQPVDEAMTKRVEDEGRTPLHADPNQIAVKELARLCGFASEVIDLKPVEYRKRALTAAAVAA